MLEEANYVLEIDLAGVATVAGSLPREVLAVARLFDGFRTVEEVLRDSPVAFETAVEVVRRLAEMGLLNMRPRRLPGSRRPGPAVDRWLGNVPDTAPEEPLEEALDRAFSESPSAPLSLDEVPFLLEKSLEQALEVQVEAERGLVGRGEEGAVSVESDDTGFLDTDTLLGEGGDPVWDLGGTMWGEVP